MNSYVALARAWRPRRFSELTGQQHVVRALGNALASGRVHHAFLFAGTRGVGKTTIARILAKCLNCERGVSAEPCGECASCREIDAGRSVDVIEVDAASRTRVDDTRELLDNVQYAPSRGRYKIYLIDEVHMLSAHSFNALLKTLEEPPPHVKFLLATTDPQKLPVTVLSRCLQFNLKRLPVELIGARLAEILTAEGIESEPAALRLIAQAGDGSLRDALSLLDQLLSYGNGRALETDARAMLGTIERDSIERLAELLATGDAAALVEYAGTLDERSPDYEQLLQALAALLERVAVRQLVPGFRGDELHAPELLQRLASRMSAEDVQLCYQTAILGRRDLALAPDARTGFRMCLLRMLAFRPPGAPERESQARAGAAETHAPIHTAANTATNAATNTPARAPVAPAAAPSAGSPPAAAEWGAIVEQLALAGALRQLATNCMWLGHEGATVRLALAPDRALLATATQVEKLAQALTRHFRTPTQVRIEQVEEAPDTLARAQERDAAERQARARAQFESDPVVEAFKQRFGASVLPDSVRPVTPERPLDE